jgi:hypothetical protein
MSSHGKYLIFGIAFLSLAALLVYILPRSQGNTYCLTSYDCTPTSCGCINAYVREDMYCPKPLWIANYTLECGCEDSQCVSVKIPKERPDGCMGTARCFFGTVERVIDGDTLVISNQTIRLAMVDAPEYGTSGYEEAKQALSNECRVGWTAIVDEDDGQTQGSYGRMIAAVKCSEAGVANYILIRSGTAALDKRFCNVSEFSDSWAVGCHD